MRLATVPTSKMVLWSFLNLPPPKTKSSRMESAKNPVPELTQEFFSYYPDYLLCRTLAINVANKNTTYSKAIDMMAKKARAAEQNQALIEEKFDLKSVPIAGRAVRLKDLSLNQILKLKDEVLKEILVFYLKNPYAHGRTKRSHWLPRWVRTYFLSALLGHARSREIQLDGEVDFEILGVL